MLPHILTHRDHKLIDIVIKAVMLSTTESSWPSDYPYLEVVNALYDAGYINYEET